MKATLLDALVAARTEKRAVVVATDLADGDQILLDGDGAALVPGDATVPPAIAQAGREALACDRGAALETPDGRRVFLAPHNPPLRLIVVGAVHISQALVPMAALAGYDVSVVDPRRAFASDARFPATRILTDWPDEGLDALAPDARTAVVTLTHDPKLDDPALDRALASPAFYIAALGSRKTHAARRARLARLGHGETALDRIHGPAGLALGAVSPAEIAVSVMAEMTQVLRQGTVA